jgi:hypothetical protein
LKLPEELDLCANAHFWAIVPGASTERELENNRAPIAKHSALDEEEEESSKRARINAQCTKATAYTIPPVHTQNKERRQSAN